MPTLRPPSSKPSPAALRWTALALASLLLHALLLLWADGRIVLPAPAAREAAPVSIALQPAPALPPPPAAASPLRRAHKARAPQAPASSVATADMTPTLADAAAASAPPAPQEAAIEEPAVEEPPEAAALPQAPQYRFNPPPPVTLKYDVKKIAVDGGNYFGSGSISWNLQDQHYVIDGDAGVLFISALSFKSSGSIDSFGVSPELYTEKKFRRAATNTHFQRERKLISFSASQVNYPRQGGEQDRASIIWQLAAIGRGDSSRITDGAELDIFVAGVRDGEIWPIRILGREEIEIGPGKTSAWHFVRSPKQGSYDQVLDIWLAPELEWYPVKLRFTESNGDYLDMSLSSLTSPAAH